MAMHKLGLPRNGCSLQVWFTPWSKASGFPREEWIGFQSEADSASSGLSSQLCGQPSQVDSVAHLLWKSLSAKGFRRSEEG